MEWFKVTEIDSNTYVLSEYNHWEEVHSYLLIGQSQAVLIDTGLGIADIRAEVKQLTDLPVSVITTHVHWDHIGGHKLFDDLWVHEADEKWMKHGLPVPLSVIRKEVLKDVVVDLLPEGFDIESYQVFEGEPNRVLVDNEMINIGDRILRIIHTPGHSPGHICIYEEEKGYIFTGDLIYSGTLFAFYPSTDPVEYKNSIDKIYNLRNIKKVLPGHHKLDLDVSILGKVKDAFQAIESEGLLHHGGGEFNYDGFSIKI